MKIITGVGSDEGKSSIHGGAVIFAHRRLHIFESERVMQLKKFSEKESKQKAMQQSGKAGLFLPENHPCHGCVWYPKDVNVLFCPFQNCVRYKKGFAFRKERPKNETG